MGSISDYRCAKCGQYTTSTYCDECMCRPAASQAIVTAALLGRGWDVAAPARENAPYDLVVRMNNEWITVQVKTAYQDGGRMRVNLSRTTDTGRTPYLPGEIDFFAVVCYDEVYLIPYGDVDSTRIDIESSKYRFYLLS